MTTAAPHKAYVTKPKPKHTYKGHINREGDDVVQVDSRDLYRVNYHSTEGLSWGYRGSGPADLALNILRHHFGETYVTHKWLNEKGKVWATPPKCWKYHQLFKDTVIARFPQDQPWTLTSDQLDEWVNTHATEATA